MNRMRLVLILVVLTSAGCQQQAAAPRVDRQEPTSVDQGTRSEQSTRTTFPLQVTDGLDRKLTLKAVPRRIVSLAPKNTEILYAIGAGDQVVGSTTYCNYPPAAMQTEKVGGFSSKSISLERIVSLKPDLVVTAGDLHAPLIQELERLGLTVLAMTAESFSGLYDEMRLLGQITGHETEAVTLATSLQERLEKVRQAAATIPEAERVSAFYMVWIDPLSGAGPGSYFGEMIKICGGRNIMDDTQARFPRLTTEVLLTKNPDVILSSTNHAGLFSPDGMRSRPGWSDLKAFHTRRIHFLDGDLISRCSPRLVDALELMARTLYPKYFAAPLEKPGMPPFVVSPFAPDQDVRGTQP